MPTYQRGAKGQEVIKIQSRLKELGFYRGPLDGDFGGGTENAVKSFQKNKRLKVDGIVGSNTWKILFTNEKIPLPVITRKPLQYRCLALTGAFETGFAIPECFAGLSGDFDGQGISLGALQWNFGQGSLQSLLNEVIKKYPRMVKEVFAERLVELNAVLKVSKAEQLLWARSIQNIKKYSVYEPWCGFFKTLGRREEFQTVQLMYAKKLFKSAIVLCKEYEIRSERAVALMFDIKVQNGSISSLVKAQIHRDFKKIPQVKDWRLVEVQKLICIANRRAEASKSEWIEDVRARKLTIANGEGTVHGNYFHLEKQYGIGLDTFTNS